MKADPPAGSHEGKQQLSSIFWSKNILISVIYEFSSEHNLLEEAQFVFQLRHTMP